MSSNNRFCVTDLKKERKDCWFNQEEITHIYDGSRKKTEIRRSLEKEIFSRPEFLDQIPPDYLSHEDAYTNELRKMCKLVDLINNDEKIQNIINQGREMGAISNLANIVTLDGNPLGVHYIMFVPALLGQGNEEQVSLWVPKALSASITGTYAQTEIGHGTNLKELETTATYDPSSEEFVINSPTLTSYKFWPGGLGKTANHAVVMAQLYTKGKCYGPHPFMVQLRDTETHKSLRGIKLSEIGATMGLRTNNNGILGFENYRIPRTNMLMKHSQVLKDGTYVPPAIEKLSYGTMIFVRATFCILASKCLAKAVTIAIRYSAVRHQSKILPEAPEPQILDFQTQQFKLIPQISSVFAITFASNSLFNMYHEVSANLNKGNYDLYPKLHAIACGLKALTSTDSSYGVDTCRLACGGNGFISSSNFHRIFTLVAATMTAEGENTVLYLQVARFLYKSHQQGRKMDSLLNDFRYKGRHISKSDISNEGLLAKWEHSIEFLSDEVFSSLEKLTSSGMKHELAWNAMSVKLVHLVQAFMRYFICMQFVTSTESLSVSSSTKSIIESLCRLYLIYHALLNQGLLLRSSSLLAENLSSLENELHELLSILRADAVNLVDAFDIHDRELNSTLGSWDGNVYERLYNEALRSPMNQVDVVEAIPKYLQPLMKSRL